MSNLVPRPEKVARYVLFSNLDTTLTNLEDANKFDVAFGNAELDFTRMKVPSEDIHLYVNAVFGNVKIYLPDYLEVKVVASSFLGSIREPNGRKTSFGRNEQEEIPFFEEQTGGRLIIHASAVLGDVKIKRMGTQAPQ